MINFSFIFLCSFNDTPCTFRIYIHGFTFIINSNHFLWIWIVNSRIKPWINTGLCFTNLSVLFYHWFDLTFIWIHLKYILIIYFRMHCCAATKYQDLSGTDLGGTRPDSWGKFIIFKICSGPFLFISIFIKVEWFDWIYLSMGFWASAWKDINEAIIEMTRRMSIPSFIDISQLICLIFLNIINFNFISSLIIASSSN